MLHEAIDILEVRFSEVKALKSYLNDRQQRIVEFIRNNQPVKVSTIAEELSAETIYTIRKDVAYLKKENIIKPSGKGRATVYYLKE
jgi:DeoR/GlpR family transcriptional regulator of sugar metabolism